MIKRILAVLLAAAILSLALPAGAALSASRGDTGKEVKGDPFGGSKPIIFYPYPTIGDRDFDGISDAVDNDTKSNTFVSVVSHDKASEGIDADYLYTYKWSYNWFKGSPDNFNKELCRLSSLIAGLGYHWNQYDISEASDDYYSVSNSLGTNMDLPQLMEAHGMTVEEYNLHHLYSDSHVTLADIGIHTVNLGTERRQVVLLALRGTNGTWAEWNSNFEVGHDLDDCEPEFEKFRFGYNEYWTDPDNHMGFDVTANRVLELLEAFVAEHADGTDDVVYWVTGHSRGAAIANICAAKLIDAGETTFAYTFACPNTTLDQNAPSYRGIFNLVNEGDLVPYLPFYQWGYTRYGSTARMVMNDSMQDEWEDMMGENYDHAETTLDNALEKLAGIIDCRNDAYTYTCSCHGNGTDDSIMTSNWYISNSNREKAIAKTPSCLTGYYKLELEDGFFYWTYHCQPPVFFVQMLAAYMCGRMTTLEFADYDIADKYETAKWSLATAALMGVGHPHFCESYFVLADHVTAYNFS